VEAICHFPSLYFAYSRLKRGREGGDLRGSVVNLVDVNKNFDFCILCVMFLFFLFGSHFGSEKLILLPSA
jgi:hypothetical protein